jgi:outer membrane receptor protein involved in Fe transport
VLLIQANFFAQNGDYGSIRGSVIDDSTNSPLEFVDVLLLRSLDSTLATGATTDANGKFNIDRVIWGEYFVRFNIVGHRKKTTPIFVIDAQRKRLNLGTIALRATMVSMDEVTVTAETPQLTYSTDRMIYNVDQDVLSRTASVSELLEDIPSVQVDVNGEVTLRGSSRVLLTINGKRSPLLEKQEGTFLEELPASSVERIEVITTPSAKYKAEGKAGIINIVLKKDTPLGTQASVMAFAGSAGRYNGNIRLNHSPGDLSVFGTYSVRKNYRNRATSDVRAESTAASPPTLSTTYVDNLGSNWPPLTHLATLGANYHFDELNSAGISGTYFQTSFSRKDYSNRVLRRATNVIAVIREYDRNGSGNDFDKEKNLTATFDHTFSAQDHKLHVEFTTSGSPEEDNYRFSNLYLSPTFPTTYDNSLIRRRDDKAQLSVDYSGPLTDVSSLEAGYTAEINRTNLNFVAEDFDPVQNMFVQDPKKTSSYGLTESIHSLYVTYKQTVGDFGVLGGVRAELDSRESNLRTLDSLVGNTFFNIFPSIHLSYTLSKVTLLRLSYSRRISRPHPRELNPFPEYRDPKNASYGDPHLLPEYIHSIELGCQVQSGRLFILPSLFFRYTYNPIGAIKAFANRSTLVDTSKNLSSEQSGGLEVICSWKAGSFFTTHVSATGFTEQHDARNIGNGQFRSQLSWSGTLTCDFNLAKRSKFEIHSHFTSLRLTPQGERFANSVVNVGLRQGLFGNKLLLTATVSDIFKTLKRETELDIPQLHQSVTITRDSRVFYLGFTYRFSTTPKKSKEEPFEYEDDE